MSLGPNGPIFQLHTLECQFIQRFLLEYILYFGNSGAECFPQPGVVPDRSHVNFHIFRMLQQQKWSIDFHVRVLETLSTIDSNVQLILLLQVCVVVST